MVAQVSDSQQPNGALLADLRQLRVFLAHPDDGEGRALVRQLQRFGCTVTSAWPPPAEPPTQAELALVLLDQESVSPASWLAGQASIAVVALVGQQATPSLRMLEVSNAHAVVVKPVQPLALLTNLRLARNNFRYEKRLLAKISKLEETLRAFRKVEQAKLILMRQRNIREHEAYEYLRKQAMNKRVSVAAVASAIVDANELLG